jgi:hypothetical protein
VTIRPAFAGQSCFSTFCPAFFSHVLLSCFVLLLENAVQSEKKTRISVFAQYWGQKRIWQRNEAKKAESRD